MTTLVAAGSYTSNLVYEHHNKDQRFTQNVRLVFPTYGDENDKQVDILSKN